MNSVATGQIDISRTRVPRLPLFLDFDRPVSLSLSSVELTGELLRTPLCSLPPVLLPLRAQPALRTALRTALQVKAAAGCSLQSAAMSTATRGRRRSMRIEVVEPGMPSISSAGGY